MPVLDGFLEGLSQAAGRKRRHQPRRSHHRSAGRSLPQSGKPLNIRFGKRGRFIGCTGYPECDYTRNLNDDPNAPQEAPVVIEDRVCPEDGGQLVVKTARMAEFIGCANYPKCKHIEPLENPRTPAWNARSARPAT